MHNVDQCKEYFRLNENIMLLVVYFAFDSSRSYTQKITSTNMEKLFETNFHVK